MIGRFIRRLFGNERGGVMIETAIAMPIIVLLVTAGFEVARLTLLHQKLDRAATAMADLVSQSENGLTVGQLSDMYNAMQHIMEPFGLGAKGVVIVTSMGTEGSNPTTIYWQNNGAGSLSATSKLGTPGNTPTLPGTMVVRSGEGLIAAEIYYDYSPFVFSDLLTATQIYKISYFRPRFDNINALSP